jgi:hypothetical protein
VITGGDDALDVFNGSGRTVGLHLLLKCFEGGKDRALNLGRRDTPDCVPAGYIRLNLGNQLI